MNQKPIAALGFLEFSSVLGLHGGELEALTLITLHNSTKPYFSLVLQTLSPHKST